MSDINYNNYLKAISGLSFETAMGDFFYGINHRQLEPAIPVNRDSYGICFFTKPLLNLQTKNIRNIRTLNHLVTTDEKSIQRIIRTTLDPRLLVGAKSLSCPLVDKNNIFIAPLTNAVESITGWPDLVLDSYVSKPGVYKEQFGFIDSVDDKYSKYTLNCNFRNIPSSALIELFRVWREYASLVHQGICSPYPDMILHREIDYNTRIWRLVLDSTKNIVTFISSTIAYPVSLPTGSISNYERDKPFNMSNQTFSINFDCFGYEIMDPILIHEFNASVCIFNPAMLNEYRDSNMVKIPALYLKSLNSRGYPRINPITRELEWYVFPDTWITHITNLDNIAKSLDLEDHTVLLR